MGQAGQQEGYQHVYKRMEFVHSMTDGDNSTKKKARVKKEQPQEVKKGRKSLLYTN